MVTFSQSSDSVYLFCYFKGSGDGLHYAYSQDGYQWKALFRDSILLRPSVSKDKLFRDPCILKGPDGMYHMVWTVSWNDRGIGYASSADLIHWSEQEFLPVMASEDSARNAWAPELSYDAKNKRYLIYWASTVNGKFPLKDTAAESKYNHRIYFTTTRDFKTFSKTRMLYDPGFSVIDATIAANGNEYVLFLKNETRYPVEKNIRVAHASRIDGPYSAPGPPITGNYWAEGPTSMHTGGRWIVYFDKYRDHCYGAVESIDLVHWKDISESVSFPSGMRHGTVFLISKKEFDQLTAH